MIHTILFLFVVKIYATVQIGQIQNANWVLNSSLVDNQYINISNITCDQCLCRMLTMNNLTTAIACQQTWKTCQLLFWNATTQLQTDNISVVYFQTIPKFLQTTENQQMTTTSFNSQHSTVVTTQSMTSSEAITSTNNPSTLITTVLETTSTTTSNVATTAAPVFLINPGGELGTLSPWIPSGGTSPELDDGTAINSQTIPHNGLYDFFGNIGGTLSQQVNLTNIFTTTQLDFGSLTVFVSFWEKSGSETSPDTGQVILTFLSATNSILSSFILGPKACTSAWCYAASNWPLPSGTRTINYAMKFTKNSGSFATVWMDDNLLDIF